MPLGLAVSIIIICSKFIMNTYINHIWFLSFYCSWRKCLSFFFRGGRGQWDVRGEVIILYVKICSLVQVYEEGEIGVRITITDSSQWCLHWKHICRKFILENIRKGHWDIHKCSILPMIVVHENIATTTQNSKTQKFHWSLKLVIKIIFP